jgi:putative DNA primase/helicase
MQPSYDDSRVDWIAFYRPYLRRDSRPVGSNKHGCYSPFRSDGDNPTAFWFNTTTGLWKDEVSGASGNPTTFLAAMENITTGEAAKRIDELAGIVRDPKPTRKRKATAQVSDDAPTYGVKVYAADKGLDAEKLAEWGLKDWRNKIVIPYKDATGVVACTRFRNPPGFTNAEGKDQRFSWKSGSSGKIIPYGVWRLKDWPADCDLILVEGESDCHALWSLGIAALGIPGASYFRPEWAAYVEGHAVFIHDEQNAPDEHGVSGSITFITHTSASLATAKFTGPVKVFATPGELKDPSDLYRTHKADAANMIAEALRGARSLDLAQVAPTPTGGTILADAGLKCPRGWVCDDRGLRLFDEELDRTRTVTATPIIITGRITEARGSAEKVRLAFKRGGRWIETITDRELAFSSRGILSVLSPLGCQITSEDAKLVVKWLGALEAANLDTIPVVVSARELGWCGSAFMPTNGGGIMLDMPHGTEDIVSAFETRGSGREWYDAMQEQRLASPVFRFIFAAGLAPALLRATNGRVFFVYNWGSSRGGKTAAIKAALSAWGDPSILMTTFNATAVGLERRAGIFRDLPLGIDERQAAGGGQDWINSLVYSISSGTGRVRGARDGGLQEQHHWRTIAIATGEEPLSGSTSKTGVSTRVLEVYGSPFASEEQAAGMHRLTGECYGHAGPRFIEEVVKLGDDQILCLHEMMLKRLEEHGDLYASSHLSGMATVLAADVLISTTFYGQDLDEAMKVATELGVSVLQRVEVSKAGDVDEAAILFIEDWLSGNVAKFSSTSFSQQIYGEKRGDTTWLVYPTPLREALENAGFSYRKTLRALEVRGAVKSDASGGATTSQRVHGEQKRVVWINGDRLNLDPGAQTSIEALAEEAF